jgi:hypothetical protein
VLNDNGTGHLTYRFNLVPQRFILGNDVRHFAPGKETLANLSEESSLGEQAKSYEIPVDEKLKGT